MINNHWNIPWHIQDFSNYADKKRARNAPIEKDRFYEVHSKKIVC
jgi:hypothetical protein